MQITIYRGTHEVGGTMIEMKTETTRILLDAGYPLFYQGEVIDDSMKKLPYQELLKLGVIPKIKGLYHWDRPEFDAVLISHAHSDHFGLLQYLHPDIPIYLSPVTDKLIKMNLTFPIPDYGSRDVRWITMYEDVAIGDCCIKPFLMDHSAFGAGAFEIKCEEKTVIYTSDFRGHGWRRQYLERFLSEVKKGPDLLLIEGTTLGRTDEKELTEQQLHEEFCRIMEESTGIVLCQPTSQNIDRIISFYSAAKKAGKIFIMDIYTANLLYELRKTVKKISGCRAERELPVPSLLRPDIHVFSPMLLSKKMDRILGKRYAKRFKAFRISKRMIKRNQKNIVMLIRPAALHDLKSMGLKNGLLIYSMWQAYREKSYQVKLEEYLKSRGFKDVYLHTSGHAFEEDIKKVITELSPKEIVPIHTFSPETFFDLSRKVTLQKDGVSFRL